jgi:hypothetical protein
MYKNFKQYLFLLFLMPLAACTGSDQAQSSHQSNGIKILPLGDSITQSDARHLSYRYPLWKMLVDTNIPFDFVGSENGHFWGSPGWPDYRGKAFDPDHEGHWGWKTDQVLDNLDSWLQGYTVDIALLHLGTNDIFYGESNASTYKELREIVHLLRQKNPQVSILLAKLIPVAGDENQITIFNAGLDEVAKALNTPESKVILVDMEAGYQARADNFDGIHPNGRGEVKMALKWFKAMMDHHLLGDDAENMK